MKVYRVTAYTDEIIEVEADRVTEKTVWIYGLQNRRNSHFERCFTTKEEAVAFLRDRLNREIKSLGYSIDKAKQALAGLEKEGE